MRRKLGELEKEIPVSALHERLIHVSGILYWKDAGKKAGHVDANGYVRVRFARRLLSAHRIIWAMETGDWPTDTIDHIDRNPLNNKMSNLRQADQQQQCRNTSAKGVCYCKQTHTWKAYLTVDGKQIWLGRHATEELALEARRQGVAEHWT